VNAEPAISYPARCKQIAAVTEADRGGVAAACVMRESRHQDRGASRRLTKAASDDLRAVLGKHKRVDERQIHSKARVEGRCNGLAAA
jgi:hypothetical protein